jgi:hypothetical protein
MFANAAVRGKARLRPETPTQTDLLGGGAQLL